MVISEFVSELSKLRPNSTLLTVKNYRNSHGELSNYSIAFHFNYKNALEKSHAIIEKYEPQSDIEVKAKEELLTSFKKSLDGYEDGPDNSVYERFLNDNGEEVKGVRMTKSTGSVQIFGNIVHKEVLEPGTYKEKKSRDLSIVKDKLRKLCPVSKFRCFCMTPEQVESIRVEKIELLPPEKEEASQ